MAKKKKKTFSKEGLLSLFENNNYQKVISKIKQFDIEGMSSKELEYITLSSYEFEGGLPETETAKKLSQRFNIPLFTQKIQG